MEAMEISNEEAAQDELSRAHERNEK